MPLKIKLSKLVKHRKLIRYLKMYAKIEQESIL